MRLCVERCMGICAQIGWNAHPHSSTYGSGTPIQDKRHFKNTNVLRKVPIIVKECQWKVSLCIALSVSIANFTMPDWRRWIVNQGREKLMPLIDAIKKSPFNCPDTCGPLFCWDFLLRAFSTNVGMFSPDYRASVGDLLLTLV